MMWTFDAGFDDEGNLAEVSLVADPHQLRDPIPPEPRQPAPPVPGAMTHTWRYPMNGVADFIAQHGLIAQRRPSINIHHFDRAQQAIRSVLHQGDYDYEFTAYAHGEEQLGDIAVGWAPMPGEVSPGWTAIPDHPLFQYQTVTDVGARWPQPVLYVRLVRKEEAA